MRRLLPNLSPTLRLSTRGLCHDRRRAARAATTEFARASTFTDIHSRIHEVFAYGRPSPILHEELAAKATSADEVKEVVATHRRAVERQHLISLGQVSTLIDACCRTADWDSLHSVLVDSRRLQLHFRDASPLNRAFGALAEHGEWARLAELHAQLPRMAIDRLGICAQLHYQVVRKLAGVPPPGVRSLLESAGFTLAPAARWPGDRSARQGQCASRSRGPATRVPSPRLGSFDAEPCVGWVGTTLIDLPNAGPA